MKSFPYYSERAANSISKVYINISLTLVHIHIQVNNSVTVYPPADFHVSVRSGSFKVTYTTSVTGLHATFS